jgi:hypothetical protein
MNSRARRQTSTGDRAFDFLLREPGMPDRMKGRKEGDLCDKT